MGSPFSQKPVESGLYIVLPALGIPLTSERPERILERKKKRAANGLFLRHDVVEPRKLALRPAEGSQGFCRSALGWRLGFSLSSERHFYGQSAWIVVQEDDPAPGSVAIHGE